MLFYFALLVYGIMQPYAYIVVLVELLYEQRQRVLQLLRSVERAGPSCGLVVVVGR